MLKTIAIPERTRNIVIAVAVAAFAAMLTAFYVANYKRHVQQNQKNAPVLVASKNIPAGTLGSEAIAKKMVSVREAPRSSIAPGAFSSPDQLETLITSDQVYAGEQVTARRFHPKEERGVRAKLDGNLRAMQVAGDQNQVLAGTLQAGDRVDVLGNVEYKVKLSEGNDVDRVASRVVLRDILVLRAATAESDTSVGSTDADKTVQLALTDAQAQKLFYVMKNGDWTLDLRPVGNAADSPESVETVESVLGDGLRHRQRAQLIGGILR